MTIPSEHIEQVNFVNWVEYNHPAIKLFAIPNGGKRSIKTAIDLKAEGVKRGVPDLFIPELFLFIEMKKQKGGSTSKEQREWLSYLEGVGYKCFVCKGAEEAKKAFTEVLTGLIS